MLIASSYAGEHQQKSPTGLWGTYVCKCCEDRFACWDDYAATILRREPVSTSNGLDFGEYDYNKLTRFFLSVLWRAHACEHVFFQNVDLASEADSVGQCLLSSDNDYLSKFDFVPTWSSSVLALGVLTPRIVPIDSISYWQLYLPRFQVLIKVILGPGATCLQDEVMAEGNNLHMVEKKFSQLEIEIAKRVFTENMSKHRKVQ